MSRYNTPDQNRLDKIIASQERRIRNLESGNRIGFTSIDIGSLVDNTSGSARAVAGSGSSTATATQTVLAAETFAALPYDDLATVGPLTSVVVGHAGRCLVMLSCNVHMVINAGDTNFGFMSFIMATVGTSIGPLDANAAGIKILNSNAAAITIDLAVSRIVPMSSIPSGTYSVTAKYSGGTGAGGAVTFSSRSLTVIPY
jgi:hypothetical protein